MRTKLLDFCIALVLVSGVGGPAIALVVGVLSSFARSAAPVVYILGFGAFIAMLVRAYRWVGSSERPRALLALRILVLGILPPWGLAYSHFLARDTCVVSSCGESEAVFRPFAEPEVYGLVVLHALTVVAYAVSRRRPEALRPLGEALVHATLLSGIVLHAVVAVHVGRWIPVGFALGVVFLPCIGPLLTMVLYGVELHARLRRRGSEAATPPPWDVADSPYRAGPSQEAVPAGPQVHRPGLLRAVALAPALLGAHAVIHALWLGRSDGALRVFTRTCGHVLSQLDVVVVPENCHYLCTVAARGHSWLVRPERLGRRGGVPIVVNRQLAIANAFEDLLHERWPRFGKRARRVYDRLGLPVSRYLRRPWLADLTYLAMKPAEWAFALALLLLDRGDPEARIDRMYR
jgi:hypothetical protein